MKTLTLSLLLVSASTLAAEAVGDQEVSYLLERVRSSGCDFVRNGTIHSAEDAADHLAMKYRRGRRWVDSAEDFIARIATGSSLSGTPYLVRCSSQPDAPSAAWLSAALTAYRGGS